MRLIEAEMWRHLIASLKIFVWLLLFDIIKKYDLIISKLGYVICYNQYCSLIIFSLYTIPYSTDRIFSLWFVNKKKKKGSERFLLMASLQKVAPVT